MGRTVPSHEEDDEIEVDEEEDPRPSGGGDDGDYEGEDGLDEYGNGTFIADSDDEEENVGEEEQKSADKSRKKKRESEEFILDEALQNNNVTGISGPKPGNQFKRFKKSGTDELLARRKQGLEREDSNSGELRAKRLEEFEPFILDEKSMAIKEKDLPERIQLSEELTGDPPTDNTTIEEESLWIHSQLTGDGFRYLFSNEHVNKDIDLKDIANVLTMLHVNKFEIPFIAMYRKEKCSSLLKNIYSYQRYGQGEMRWHKLLWAVQTLDRKWLLLQKRKFALELYYVKRFDDKKWRAEDVTRQKFNRQLYNSIIEALKDAKSDKDVEDIDAKFNLHFPPVEVEEGQFKRPKRKSLYSIYHKAGLWEVANQFGHSSEQLGHHLTLTNIHYVSEFDSRKDSPEDVAANFTCGMFETPQDVLRGARYMAAIEVSREPIVRKHIRSIFMNKAVVSTCPTPEGNTIIDPYHQLSGVKWLREKPLDKFVDAQWLLIQKAEDEKLLKVTVKLPEDAKTELMSDTCENYLSDCVSNSTQLWDEQRKMILDDAFFSFLLPSMEKEARSLLTANAKHCLQMEYAKQLWNKVAVAPWKKMSWA